MEASKPAIIWFLMYAYDSLNGGNANSKLAGDFVYTEALLS